MSKQDIRNRIAAARGQSQPPAANHAARPAQHQAQTTGGAAGTSLRSRDIASRIEAARAKRIQELAASQTGLRRDTAARDDAGARDRFAQRHPEYTGGEAGAANRARNSEKVLRQATEAAALGEGAKRLNKSENGFGGQDTRRGSVTGLFEQKDSSGGYPGFGGNAATDLRSPNGYVSMADLNAKTNGTSYPGVQGGTTVNGGESALSAELSGLKWDAEDSGKRVEQGIQAMEELAENYGTVQEDGSLAFYNQAAYEAYQKLLEGTLDAQEKQAAALQAYNRQWKTELWEGMSNEDKGQLLSRALQAGQDESGLIPDTGETRPGKSVLTETLESLATGGNEAASSILRHPTDNAAAFQEKLTPEFVTEQLYRRDMEAIDREIAELEAQRDGMTMYTYDQRGDAGQRMAEEHRQAVADIDAKLDALRGEQYYTQAHLDLAKLDAETVEMVMQVPKWKDQRALNAGYESGDEFGGEAGAALHLELAEEAQANLEATETALRDRGLSDREIERLYDIAQREYNYEQTMNMREALSQAATQNFASGALLTAASVPMNLASGVGFIEQAVRKLKNEFGNDYVPLDDFSPMMQGYHGSNAIRGGIADRLDNGKWTGKALSFLYQTGASMLDSAATAAITAATGLPASVLLGGSAATNGMMEAKERGATDSQAIWIGLVSGAAEALFEKVSIDRLLGEVEPESVRALVRNMVTQAFTEGTEEVNTTIANTIADAIIMGDKSAIQTAKQEYMAQGMDEGAAYRKAMLDAMQGLLLDFAGGALSGGIMVGTVNAANWAGYSGETKRVGSEFNAMGPDVVQSIIDEGLAAGKGTKNYKMAIDLQNQINAGKTVSDRQVGELYRENVQTVDAKSDAEVETAGFESEDTLEQTAREAVTEKENTVSEATSKPTTAERPSYNVLNQNANTAQRTTSADTKPSCGENGTKVFQSIVEDSGQTPDQVRMRFSSAYEAGLVDLPRARASLSDTIQEMAYNAGRMDRILSMKKTETKGATVWGKEGGVIENDYSAKLDKQTHGTLQAIGKSTGTKIIIEAIPAEKNANGYYKDSTGTIHIDVNTTDPVMTVVKHELTHRMQALAPKEYRQFRDYAVEVMSESGWSMYGSNTAVENQQRLYRDASSGNVNLTTEEAMDEIAAEFTKKILTDEKALNDFVNHVTKTPEHRTMGQKFFQAVREFIDKVKRIFKGDKAKMDKEAQDRFGATVSQLEKAEQLWKEAYRASEKNAQELSQKAQKNTDQADGVQYSLNPDFEKQFDAWLKDKKSNAGANSFLVGTTSDALKSIGVSDYKIYWNKSKLAKIMKEHPAMTADVIKSVPGVLESPILVMQSQTVANRITLFGEAMDADGKPVLVAVELRPQNKSGEVMDFAVIASTYGKNGAQRIIDTSNILYVDPNKKRTDNWLGLLRLQLPSRLTKYGSIDMVTYVNKDVNGVISSGDTGGKTAMQEALETAIAKKGAKYTQQTTDTTNQTAPAEATGAKDNTHEQFSLKKPVEETKDLLALHNLTEQNLLDSIKLGGFPMPSIAVVKSTAGHSKYGPISLVFNKSTIDPAADSRNKVYGGDAYTPTAPTVEYPVNYDVMRGAEKRFEDLSKTLANGIFSKSSVIQSMGVDDSSTMSIDELADRLSRNDTVKAAYLADKGETLEIKYKPKEFDNFGNKALQAYIDKVGIQKLEAMISEMKENDDGPGVARREEDSVKALMREVFEEQNRRLLDKKPELKEKRLDKMIENRLGSIFRIEDFIRHAWDYHQDNGATSDEIDRWETTNELNRKADGTDVKEWVAGQLEGMLGDPGIYNGKDRFTPSGRDRTFKELHWSYTLENIVKAMTTTQKARGEATFGTDAKSLQATATPSYGSIQEIKSDSNRLGKVEGDEYEAQVSAVEEQLADAIGKVRKTNKAHSDNSFEEEQIIGDIMQDAATGKKTIDAIVKAFKKEDYAISTATAKAIQDVYNAAAALPTEYFEAKPERAVGFDEVLAAVVPDTVDQKIRTQMEQAGLNVVEYKSGDEASRLEAVNSVDGAQFSLKGQDDLMKKYEKLREVNEGLKEQLKTTTFAKVDKKSLDTFTKKLLKDYSSGADINETRAALDDLYGYIANGEDGNAPAWNEVYKRAYEASVNILEGASVTMDDDYRQYKELRDTIRNTGLTISDRDKPDLHNGYQAFRKANMGRIKLVNDGLPVDSFYQELASSYPEFFDEYAHTHPADQLENIADVLDSLQPYEVNPYSHNMRESATWLANDIIERFYELPQAKPTFADKANRKLTEQVIKDTKKLEKLREQKNTRISEIIAKNRDKVKEVTTKERAKRTEAVQKVKEHYTEKEARASDRRKISIFKSKINKHVANISKMLLKPTETSHVPESLRGTVSGFLSVLDLTTERQQEKTLNRLNDLRNQYQKIADGKHDVVMEVDPDLIDNIDAVISALGNDGTISISDLKARELESLYRVTLAVERSIYSYNRAMTEGMNATISDLGQAAMIENSAGKGYQESSVRPKQWAADLLNMDMLNPQDFFMQMGGTMESLYHSIRKGFDQKIRNTAIAQDYMKDLVKDVDLKKISGEKARTQEFKTANGRTISLTPAQVMSLYLLQKQPDALDHIYVGGIKQAPTVALKGKDRRPSITRSYDVVKVTPDDVAKILGSLTPEQRKIADGIGEFFTKYTAEWGNEVSLALYGYKKFTVENYFPIVSDRNYIADVFGETQDSTLKNMGSTKSRQKGANNPVIIEDVFDVYTRQADQMSSYNAFVIPLSDMQRVFNYKTMDGSVKQSIEKRFGTRATRYFKQLMTDINGGAHYNGGSPIMNDLISKYKQAKLGLNLRVIVQQPTAYLRAAAMIDPKYIAAAIPIRNTAKTETIYKYAPIAQWKDWGYFSMDTGKRMRSLIMGEKELSDYTMWAAGKMDEITWKTLWTATELEIRDKRPELKRGSDEYYEAIGERFSEVIDRTQVVDSTLHRSQALRNPDTAYKMAVSFMSEPIKAYNLLRSAVVEAKNNPSVAAKKALGAAVGGYVASIVVNHLVTALVDTMRGEDDDEPWLEEVVNKIIGKDDEENKEHTWQHRYIWNFVDNLVNEPLSMIPFAKDITSLVQGFDIKRMDSQGISDFLNAGKRALSDKYTIGFKIADMSSKAADLFGIPASNVRRELSTMTKYLIGAMDSPWMEYQNEKLWNNIGSSKNRGKFLDILYKAYEAGDTDAYNRIVEDLMDNGIAASSIESGMRSRAKKAGVDVDSINSLTTGIGIKPKYDVGESEEEESYTVDNLTGAQYTQYIEDRGDMVDQIIRDFNNNGFGSLDAETANELLSAAYKYAEETALEDASGGAYESDTKWIDKAQNADALGLTTSEYIMLMNEYGASSIGADGVYEAYDAGIDVETYLEFKAATKDMKADKDADGNSISGSKKEKVIDYMNTMGLTQDEYDALLEIAGYKSDDEKSGFGSSSFGSSSFGKSSFGKSSFGKSTFGSK